MENACRSPIFIELQTFFVNAVRIVNDRPLTTVSNQPNGMLPITPSCFLGQHLSPNTPLCGVHNNRDLRMNFLCNCTFASLLWSSWIKSYISILQGRSTWRTLGSYLVPGSLYLRVMPKTLPKGGLSPWFNKLPAPSNKYESNLCGEQQCRLLLEMPQQKSFSRSKTSYRICLRSVLS